ncbi:MAG: sulfite exporter TauE/SafE family protein [Oligoflexales bacterium]|nr:sulfite exporter TauE/SafE family protein [Oligoflexales bacterium]
MDLSCRDHSNLSLFLSSHQLGTLDLATLGVIWSLSFVSSLHCLAMCSPLVCAHLKTCSKKKSALFVYNLARALSYPLLGASAAFFGAGVSTLSYEIGVFLSILIGTILLLLSTPLRINNPWRSAFQTISNSTILLNNKIIIELKSQSQLLRSFVLGFLTVIFPCMSLTPIVILSITAGSPLKGALLLFSFYLGTVPAMVLGPALMEKGSSFFTFIPQQKILSALLFLAGLVTIVRVFHA